MLLILLEALLALALLVLIVWWTMFSGRPGGEPPAADDPETPGPATGPAASGPAGDAGEVVRRNPDEASRK
ncbi:MAG: hypothetical protein RL513_1748 [Pseudomonadota bacterium]|jgi:hypothetical protein